MYKQNPGDPVKKLNTPTTFSERSTFMKLAKDPSNEMFNTGEDSGLNKHEAGHKENGGGEKRKLGTEGMTYEQKMDYYKKQKEAKSKKNSNVSMGMGSNYTSLKKD